MGHYKKQLKFAHIKKFNLLGFLLIGQCLYAQMGLRYPGPGTSVVDLHFARNSRLFSIVTSENNQPFQWPSSYKYNVDIDSSGRTVIIDRQAQYPSIFTPRIFSFSDYLQYRSEKTGALAWKAFVRENTGPFRSKERRGRGITIESPRIMSDSFRRITGGDRLSLNITGRITIDTKMTHEDRESIRDATNRPPSTNFQMKQTQNFNITGKIGENISVNVQQDSETDFEFENAVKLRYSSDEDGIIKSIEAGNVSLNLPSTHFVTFSQQNAGLFGFKTELQLGNLGITAIASMQKGEKKTLSISGEGKTDEIIVKDYEYRRNTYFFLDHAYRENYAKYELGKGFVVDPSLIIEELEVYRYTPGRTEADGAFEAWALANPDEGIPESVSAEAIRGYFLPLETVRHYDLHNELGYIMMNMPLQDQEVLAVAYKTRNGNQHGQLSSDISGQNEPQILKLIKTQQPQPSYSTWDLEWKNVYYLGVQNITDEEFESSFDVQIYYNDPQQEDQETIEINGEVKSFINIFGLDVYDAGSGQRRSDGIIDNNVEIFHKGRGEIIMPNMRPFDPRPETGVEGTFSGIMDSDNYRTPAIYDTTLQNYIQNQSKFYFKIESSRKSPEYNLGFNIIEGSEEVFLNNRPLTKDIDYTIDYFTGRVVLLNPDATLPDADIKINYESQRMFAMDKTSIFGARAEYTLWEDTQNRRSFIGATLLYLNKSVIDKRVRLGQEAPMRNLVWDINTALHFRSESFYNYLNIIPFLETSGPLNVSVEAEVAQIIPNPNTLNNSKTGDNNGVAYIDDFNGASRTVPLGTQRRNWKPAAIPSASASQDTIRHYIENQGFIVWYNPMQGVHKQDIWPEREVSNNFQETTTLYPLVMDFYPNPGSGSGESWAAVQRALSTGYYDQTESRYLEIWLQLPDDGHYPNIHVDLGQISEDVIPNSRLDTEAFRPPGGIRNVNMTPEYEDAGLDGMFGDDPPELFYQHVVCTVETDTIFDQNGNIEFITKTAHPYDFWDINGDGIKQEWEPYSYDDYYYQDRSDVYFAAGKGAINGTEDNINDGDLREHDTEDMNRNGVVDQQNNYFRFSFNTSPDHPDTSLIAGGKSNEKRWRMFRIPLDSPSGKFGSPEWTRIESARIMINGTDRTSGQDMTTIRFAEINLVGNEWKYHGLQAAGDSLYVINIADETEDPVLEIKVINTFDNPEYQSPPGVEGELDPTTRLRGREQSLVLQYNRLQPGESAIAKKQFFEGQNLIQYNTLKMFLYGDPDALSLKSDSSEIEFFLRFGTDTRDQIYYEVSLPHLKPGWDGNSIEVDFTDLSRLKIEMETLLQDTISEKKEGQTLFIKGKPSLTDIKWLIAGIRNNSGESFTGQIWMNELRLSDVKKDRGMAYRANAQIQLADFMTINANIDRRDANFHTINERTMAGGAFSENINVSATMNIDRFLPREWGINIPVSVRYGNSLSTPKYMPGTDILLSRETASDSLLNALSTINESRSTNIRFSKTTRSHNPLVRYLIDPWSGNASISETRRSDSRTLFSDNIQYQGSISYRLNFGSDHYTQPLKFLGETGILSKLANMKIYYLPRSINFKMDGNDLTQEKETTSGIYTSNPTATLERHGAIQWVFTDALTVDYSRNARSNMLYDSTSTWKEALTSIDPGTLVGTNQNFSAKYNPTLAAWLSSNFQYSSQFGYNFNPQMAEQGTARSATQNKQFQVSGTFDPAKLIQSFSKTKQPAQRPALRQPARRRLPDSVEPEKEEEKEEKSGFNPLAVFSILGKIFESIDPIRFTYSDQINEREQGLTDMPSSLYQFGFTDDPGVGIEENLTGDRSSFRNNQRLSLSSGFKIGRIITINMDYQITNNNTISGQSNQNQNTSRSVLFFEEGTDPVPMPGWRVALTGVEKILPEFLGKHINRISINHQYEGKEEETLTDGAKTSIAYNSNFRPLIRAAIDFKSGMNASFSINQGMTITEQTRFGNRTEKKSTSEISFQLSHRISGGIKLPFMKNRLENNINFSITFNKSLNLGETKTAESGFYQTTSLNKNWSFKPTATYSFTKNVQGGIHIELGERENYRMGKTKFRAFGINASINLGN